jgi:MFS transporter, DHA3 family, macrolide efflux protein
MTEAVLYRRNERAWGIGGLTGFILLSIGQIVSLIGSGMTCFAQSMWIYTDMGGSIVNLTALAVLAQLPGVFISPIAGVLVDRWDRRWVMIISNAVAALATLVLRMLIMSKNFQIWHVFMIVVVISIANHFQWPAFFATVPLVVPKKNLGSANGLIQMARALGQVAAPFMAGIAVTLFRIEGVILFDMISYLVAFATLLIVSIPRPPVSVDAKVVRGSFKREFLYGWKYLLERRGLFELLVLFAASNFLLAVVSLLLMPMALNTISASQFGLLVSIGGVSMIISSLAISVWGVPKRRMPVILGAMVVQGVAIMVGGLQPSFWLFLCASAVFYSIAPLMGACSEVVWQSKVAPDVQGRVMAATWMASIAAAELGYLIAGPLADYLFLPVMAKGGALAGSLGLLVGVGPGRGIGLMFVIFGFIYVIVALRAMWAPSLRNIDKDLPDAIDSVAASKDAIVRSIGTAMMRE